MIIRPPYFLKNKEWYRVTEKKDKYDFGLKLTDKAPPKAVESFNWYKNFCAETRGVKFRD